MSLSRYEVRVSCDPGSHVLKETTIALPSRCSRRRLSIEVLPEPNSPKRARTGVFATISLAEIMSTSDARPMVSSRQYCMGSSDSDISVPAEDLACDGTRKSSSVTARAACTRAKRCSKYPRSNHPITHHESTRNWRWMLAWLNVKTKNIDANDKKQ